jgi:hypothetical protein
MNARTVAFLVYVLGILVAACAAAKLPASGSRWPDTLPLFAVGFLLACGGLVYWRASLVAGREEDERRGTSAKEVLAYLEGCRDEAVRIRDELPSLDADTLRGRVDRLLSDYITPFIESRSVLVETLGMKQGAEIILQASAAERNFNRAWSAAADSCLPEAQAAFRTATATAESIIALLEAKHL